MSLTFHTPQRQNNNYNYNRYKLRSQKLYDKVIGYYYYHYY